MIIETWLIEHVGPVAAKWILRAGGALALILIVLALGLGIRHWYVSQKIKETSAKVEAAKIATIEAHSEVEKVEKDVTATQEELEAVKEKAKAADERLIEVIKNDSTTQPEDVSAAWRRFCALYPDDKRCL